MAQCYHCRQPIGLAVFKHELAGETRRFCCAGCMSVAALVHGGGLQEFYQFRDQSLIPPTPLTEKDADYYRLHDRDDVLQRISTADDSEHRAIRIGIEGITCAACVWLLEQHIGKLEGVKSLWVNLGNHRAELVWDQRVLPLSQIFAEMHRLGYRPYPFSESEEEKRLTATQKTTLIRIGIAGIGMMQNMMLATPVYFGLLEESGEAFLSLFWYISLLIATPVVFFSAKPFFIAARRDLQTGHLTMDVPVSLAIGGAYVASVFITIFGGKEVYYDAVCMFTFFLLVGRYLEGQARIASSRTKQKLGQSTPTLVRIVREGGDDLKLIENLRVGDCVRVMPGEMIPVDGEIVEGISSVNEAALTGEFHPIGKGQGDSVLSGSILLEDSIVVRTARTQSQSNLSVLQKLVNRAMSEKPQIVVMADKIASYFVRTVLVASVFIAIIWWFINPDLAFTITLSVLVATCPCALSLATPTALTTATTSLREMGFVVTRSHVIQTLARANRIYFDKTGTLTTGAYTLIYLDNLSAYSERHLLNIAGALEKDSPHPVARFFRKFSETRADEIKNISGSGVTGRLDGKDYLLGKASFAGQVPTEAVMQYPNCTAVYLTENNQLIAVFILNDEVRSGVIELVSSLKQQFNIESGILTGDPSSQGNELARQLQISCESGQTPEQKLQKVREAAKAETIVMVGDGLNDVPAMAGSHLSIAMANASDLTQVEADALLLNPDLLTLGRVIQQAKRTERIIKQNLIFSFGYNLSILPLAAAGYVPPWVAAIGMSASSLIVVLNALRLSSAPKSDMKVD